MSTFSGLNTSYTALVAARTAIEVAGQNIANVKTPGYTRQRAELVSNPALGYVGLFAPPKPGVGQGVNVGGIARLADGVVDRLVRTTSATAGFHGVRAAALASLEQGFSEPGPNGISAQLQEFWAAWQDLGNHAGSSAASAVVLEEAGALASRIAAGHRAATDQWKSLRGEAAVMTDRVNAAAADVAELNRTIRSTLLAGGNVNELLDQRDRLALELADLAGGVVDERADGTVDVLVGGNPVVTGTTAHRVVLTGPTTPGGVVALEWERRPGAAVALDDGALGGALSMLAPADAGGTGGALAEAAAAYDRLATRLAEQVNAVHRTGATTGGATGLDFFALDPGVPPALGLRVVPTDASGIAAGAVGGGALDGSIADAISGIGLREDAPDALWSAFVAGVGVTSKAEAGRAMVAGLAAGNAFARQQSGASVDLDEENLGLVLAQTAYQGAARVFTAIDEMLDTLVNRTGIVGR